MTESRSWALDPLPEWRRIFGQRGWCRLKSPSTTMSSCESRALIASASVERVSVPTSLYTLKIETFLPEWGLGICREMMSLEMYETSQVPGSIRLLM